MHCTAWATADATFFPTTLLKGIPNLLPVIAAGFLCFSFLLSHSVLHKHKLLCQHLCEEVSVQHCVSIAGLLLRLSHELVLVVFSLVFETCSELSMRDGDSC